MKPSRMQLVLRLFCSSSASTLFLPPIFTAAGVPTSVTEDSPARADENLEKELALSALALFPFGGRTREQRERLYDTLHGMAAARRTTGQSAEQDDAVEAVPGASTTAEAAGSTASNKMKIKNPHLPPVLFVHGMIGATIKADLKDRKKKHFYCAKDESNVTIWLNPTKSFLPLAFECWRDNIALHWREVDQTVVLDDESVGIYSSLPDRDRKRIGADQPPYGYYGPDSPAVGPWNYYLWGNLTEQLEYANTQAGILAYDWRKGPEQFAADGTFQQVKDTVEWYYENSGSSASSKKRVALLSISMGAPFLLWFLKWAEDDWKEKHLEVWFSLSGVFAGAPEMISETIMPTDRDVYGITTKKPFDLYITKPKIRDIVASWAGPVGMLPAGGEGENLFAREVLWVATEDPSTVENVGGKSKLLPYRGNPADLARALADSGQTIAAKLWQANIDGNWTVERSFFQGGKQEGHKGRSPGVNLECMYGVNVPTEIGWVYGDGFQNSPTETLMENETVTEVVTGGDENETFTGRTTVGGRGRGAPAAQPLSGDGVVNLLSLDYCRTLWEKQSQYSVKVSRYDGYGHTDFCNAVAPFARVVQVLKGIAEKNERRATEGASARRGGDVDVVGEEGRSYVAEAGSTEAVYV